MTLCGSVLVSAGRGVKRDAQAALSYYGMAFDLGHWKAPYALGSLYAGDERELSMEMGTQQS